MTRIGKIGIVGGSKKRLTITYNLKTTDAFTVVGKDGFAIKVRLSEKPI